ncbi:hypothetical protein Q1695_000638 [Nippostrongylus brasiliensis]|nr:hypothetical protein Q1695_000638 [Nippostrongylus brasiliensis]
MSHRDRLRWACPSRSHDLCGGRSPGRGRSRRRVTAAPPIVVAPFEMSSRHTYAVLFIASILVLQYVAAESDDMYDMQRVARAPKFIRFGRAGGAKFIRFGRSGSNTWDDDVSDDIVDVHQDDKRAAKFIRFG